MKLAEALAKRKIFQTRLDELKERIKNNVKVQENDEPLEDPMELFHELEDNILELSSLIKAINKTNMLTLHENRTITSMLMERDALRRHLKVMRQVLEKAIGPYFRYSKDDVKFKVIIDTEALKKDIDDRSKQLRLLDLKIQTLNFETELIE